MGKYAMMNNAATFLRQGQYTSALELLVRYIDEKASPIANAQRGLVGLRVEGDPPCMIDIEPAPTEPARDDHTAMLDVIRELASSQNSLLDIIDQTEFRVFPSGYVFTLAMAREVVDRASAILAEHDALDIAPERSDEDL